MSLASIELKFQIGEDSVMFDVETLWADFARPIVSADDYHQFPARTPNERVLQGGAGV